MGLFESCNITVLGIIKFPSDISGPDRIHFTQSVNLTCSVATGSPNITWHIKGPGSNNYSIISGDEGGVTTHSENGQLQEILEISPGKLKTLVPLARVQCSQYSIFSEEFTLNTFTLLREYISRAGPMCLSNSL